MPIAATGSDNDGINSVNVATTASQMSFASCSTQPGCGKCWGNSRYDQPQGAPDSSTAKARMPVVPASIAITTPMERES